MSKEADYHMESLDIDISSFLSKFGVIHVALSGKGIFSLEFYGSRAEFVKGLISGFGISEALIREDHAVFSHLFKSLERYFKGDDITFDVALDLRGTPFQRSIWRELVKVPFGSVISYGELAIRAGSPKGARAAGSACKANPVPLIVPCHRVVTSAGGIGGFNAGLSADDKGRKGRPSGVDLKRTLLRLEGVDI